MKTYEVPVHWTMSATVVVQAENADDAIDLACGIDVDYIEDALYEPDSFEIGGGGGVRVIDGDGTNRPAWGKAGGG